MINDRKDCSLWTNAAHIICVQPICELLFPLTYLASSTGRIYCLPIGKTTKSTMRAYIQLPFLLLALSAKAQDELYDFVVAGAGTAGLVVANRLSADPNIRVAVIDPGDDVRDYPGVLTLDDIGNTFNASIDWAYSSIPQPSIGGRSIQYHAGRAIGGSSTINGASLHAA
jgi:hypothetical protein